MSLLFQTLILTIITMLPALELRASIPLGVLSGSITVPFIGVIEGFGLPWWYVFVVCVIANVLVGVLAYIAIGTVVKHVLLRWGWFSRFWHKQVERVQKKIHNDIERWGWLGLAVFIGVPLPGTGVYSGAIAAYALGMGFRKYFLATVLGVIIAAIIVMLISLGALALFS